MVKNGEEYISKGAGDSSAVHGMSTSCVMNG